MAASCPPGPHVNVFGVHTAYGPVHPGTHRVGRAVGAVAGLVVGTAALVRGLLRKR